MWKYSIHGNISTLFGVNNMDEKEHWENFYKTKSPDAVSWFQEHSDRSLQIIAKVEPNLSAGIIDIGGGASRLVDDLMERGYSNLSVLDISLAALEVAMNRLGAKSSNVNWIEQDVTQLVLAKHSIDVWHDRAVFHFLTRKDDRKKYVDNVLNAVKPGGHVIISTFSLDGPEECSGLIVQRYDENSLHGEFGQPFSLLGHEKETHQTPFGTQQQFVYCYCRVNS